MPTPSLFPILTKAQAGSVTIGAPLDTPLEVDLGLNPINVEMTEEAVDVDLTGPIVVEVSETAIEIDIGAPETEIEV